MAISANTVWELRTDGADTNGGGFVAGATGTDRSTAALPFANGTNLTVDSGTDTDVAPDGYSPVAADVGNLIRVSAGGGFSVGWYEIQSIQAGKWRLDRSPAAANTAGGTWALGGAALSPALVMASAITGNTVYLRGGATPLSNPFSVTVNTNSVAGGKPSHSTRVRVIGYGTVRGDGVRAVVKAGVNYTAALWTSTGSSCLFMNLEFDGNKANFTGAIAGSLSGSVINCHGYNAQTIGLNAGGQTSFKYCVAYNNTTIGISTASATGLTDYCVAYNNTTFGFSTGGVSLKNCVAYGNGSGGYTSSSVSNPLNTVNCVAYNNTGPGFTLTANGADYLANCVATNNSTYGYAGGANTSTIYNCAHGGNGTAGVQNSGTLIETNSITLTADPFTNAPSADFSLNSVPGGGGALKAAGVSTVGSNTSYSDVGVVQRSASTRGGYMKYRRR